MRAWRPHERTEKMIGGSGGSKFLFLGNRACLDFANTQVVDGGRPVDLLGGFADLVVWLSEAGLLDADAAEEALGRWDRTPEGERAFGRALSFRAALRGAFERVVEDEPVPRDAVDEVNTLLAGRLGRDELVESGEGFERRFRWEAREAEHLLAPVADSAADLFSRDDASLVKRCENPECVLFFYDTSKNHARRWCSMATCGNRMKVRAHLERVRGRLGSEEDGAALRPEAQGSGPR